VPDRTVPDARGEIQGTGHCDTNTLSLRHIATSQTDGHAPCNGMKVLCFFFSRKKHFFSEEKKQKTFVGLARGRGVLRVALRAASP
jgi:hypothetical protein